MTASMAHDSRLTCERCHGIGSDDPAAGKIFWLITRLEVVDLKTNRVATEGRKLGFAIVQDIEQQAGLELVGSFGAGKTIDKTLDLHFFRGKSNRRHDGPPRRRQGLESLAALAADSSRFPRQAWSEVVSKHQECRLLRASQTVLNILHRKEYCGAFRKLSRGLKGGFARNPNPLAVPANRVASTPATVTNKRRKRRNCMATESNDLKHFSLYQS
jgi:hypothetical protein